MEDSKVKRIYWIDAAKIIAMILIVISHTIAYSDKLQGIYKYVSSFHVAFFFAISGFTFSIIKYKNFREFFKIKFKRIMIPYFSFAIIFLIPFLLLGAQVATELDRDNINIDLMHSIIGIFYGNGHDNYLRQNSSLWFLPCLFITECIFYFIEKIKYTHKYYIAIIVSIIIGALDYYLLPIRLPWGCDIAITMIAFFSLGKIIISKKQIKSKKIFIPVSIILIVLGGIIQHFNTNIMYMHNEYGNYFIFLLSAFFSVIGYTILIQKMPFNSIIQYMGKRTMSILIFHKVFVLIFQTKLGIVSQLLKQGSTVEQIAMSSITVICSIGLSLVIEKIVNRICPWILGNTKKGEDK